MPKPFLAILAVVLLPAAARAETYVRAGAGFEASSEAGFRDRDCSQAAPAALFGCGAAADGQPLTARGDFGAAATVDLGLGRRVSPYLRLEALASYRPDLDFSGRANFPNTPGAQPVAADLDSLSALAVAYVDLGVYGRLRPFLGLGLGVARNRLGRAAYALPGLGADATTVLPGATRTGAAWMAAAGVSWPLSARTTLDLAYRYADLGEVRTGAGRAVVTRPGAARTLDLAPTRAALVTQGVSASLRWAF